jgi:hypothetical protein
MMSSLWDIVLYKNRFTANGNITHVTYFTERVNLADKVQIPFSGVSPLRIS